MHILTSPLRRFSRTIRASRSRYRIWLIEDLGLAYLPVPKAASSSIRQCVYEHLGQTYHGPDWARLTNAKAALKQRFRHSLTAAQIDKSRAELHVFSFVRNPLARLYSCYRDKVVNAEQRRETCTLAPFGIRFGIDFDTFIRRVAEIPDEQADQHFRSQHCFIIHRGQPLADFIGHVESFAEDWSSLQERFNLPDIGRNRRLSGPPTALTTLPVSRSTAEVAVERYRQDIELFGYQKEIEAMLEKMR